MPNKIVSKVFNIKLEIVQCDMALYSLNYTHKDDHPTTQG